MNPVSKEMVKVEAKNKQEHLRTMLHVLETLETANPDTGIILPHVNYMMIPVKDGKLYYIKPDDNNSLRCRVGVMDPRDGSNLELRRINGDYEIRVDKTKLDADNKPVSFGFTFGVNEVAEKYIEKKVRPLYAKYKDVLYAKVSTQQQGHQGLAELEVVLPTKTEKKEPDALSR